MSQSLHILEEGKSRLLFEIVQVGAGANGGQFFRSLCQDIATYFMTFKKARSGDTVTFGVDLTICDADRYEEKNLSNQLCTQEDLNEYKVVALAERYADVYGLSIKSVTQYVKTQEMLHRLFAERDTADSVQRVKVLVGMVDNNKSRQLFHDFFYSDTVPTMIWIDAGVTGVKVNHFGQEVPNDKEARESGFSGQVVVGFKYNHQVILPPVTVMFPDMLEDAGSHFPDESCGELIINNPQRSATNRMAAQIANNIMNNLFHSQRIYNHVIHFNAQMSGSGGRTSFITKEQASLLKVAQNRKKVLTHAVEEVV